MFTLSGERDLVEESLGIRIHELLVQVICDSAAILDLGNHVPHSLPSGLTRFPSLHVNEVILSCKGVPENSAQDIF